MSCRQQFWSRNTIWLAVKSSVPLYGHHLYVLEVPLFESRLIICMCIHNIYITLGLRESTMSAQELQSILLMDITAILVTFLFTQVKQL